MTTIKHTGKTFITTLARFKPGPSWTIVVTFNHSTKAYPYYNLGQCITQLKILKLKNTRIFWVIFKSIFLVWHSKLTRLKTQNWIFKLEYFKYFLSFFEPNIHKTSKKLFELFESSLIWIFWLKLKKDWNWPYFIIFLILNWKSIKLKFWVFIPTRTQNCF